MGARWLTTFAHWQIVGPSAVGGAVDDAMPHQLEAGHTRELRRARVGGVGFLQLQARVVGCQHRALHHEAPGRGTRPLSCRVEWEERM